MLTGAMALLTACGAPSDTETGTQPQSDSRGEPSVSVAGDTTFLELPIGTSASNADLSVRFDAVTSDSRCPTGVQCVWEGNAGIRITVTNRDETQVYVLNSATEPQWVAFLQYAIGFRDLSPHPTSVEAPNPSEYVATVAIMERSAYTPAPSESPPPGAEATPGDRPGRFVD
jgi:hypothetical protein